jgi:hypothetical protein
VCAREEHLKFVLATESFPADLGCHVPDQVKDDRALRVPGRADLGAGIDANVDQPGFAE